MQSVANTASQFTFSPNCLFPPKRMSLPQPVHGNRASRTRESNKGWRQEEVHVSSRLFSYVDQFPEGIPYANSAGSSAGATQGAETATAPKLAKWPKYNDRTASLGWGSITLVLK